MYVCAGHFSGHSYCCWLGNMEYAPRVARKLPHLCVSKWLHTCITYITNKFHIRSNGQDQQPELYIIFMYINCSNSQKKRKKTFHRGVKEEKMNACIYEHECFFRLALENYIIPHTKPTVSSETTPATRKKPLDVVIFWMSKRKRILLFLSFSLPLPRKPKNTNNSKNKLRGFRPLQIHSAHSCTNNIFAGINSHFMCGGTYNHMEPAYMLYFYTQWYVQWIIITENMFIVSA